MLQRAAILHACFNFLKPITTMSNTDNISFLGPSATTTSRSESLEKSNSMVIVLDKEYGYVIFILAAYVFLNIYMQIQVGRARKKYNVLYPTLYATEADTPDHKLFNCIQRGHQNSLENLPIFFVLMVVGGFKHPIVCTGLGLAYIITRFFYFIGYSSGDPNGRLPIGGFNTLALLGLVGVNIWFGVSLVTE